MPDLATVYNIMSAQRNDLAEPIIISGIEEREVFLSPLVCPKTITITFKGGAKPWMQQQKACRHILYKALQPSPDLLHDNTLSLAVYRLLPSRKTGEEGKYSLKYMISGRLRVDEHICLTPHDLRAIHNENFNDNNVSVHTA